MPEAAEVRRITDKLRSRLKGKSLVFITWIENNKYSQNLSQNWPMVEHLFPSICLDILCKGKQIFFFLENGLALISGLGMEGHWYYFNCSSQNQVLHNYIENKNHRMFCLHFGRQFKRKDVSWNISETQVWYDDTRSFGNFTITSWSNAFTKMKQIGPDLLATTTPFKDISMIIRNILPQEFFVRADLNMFKQEIRSGRRTQMELCRFLMNQEYFAGCGNYLLIEILYRSRLHPERVLGSLTDDDISVLFSNCLATIQQAYEHGGLTHGTFLDPDMMKGQFVVQVYKRESQLDINGFIIKRIQTSNGRSSYIVEELQQI